MAAHSHVSGALLRYSRPPAVLSKGLILPASPSERPHRPLCLEFRPFHKGPELTRPPGQCELLETQKGTPLLAALARPKGIILLEDGPAPQGSNGLSQQLAGQHAGVRRKQRLVLLGCSPPRLMAKRSKGRVGHKNTRHEDGYPQNIAKPNEAGHPHQNTGKHEHVRPFTRATILPTLYDRRVG